MGSLGAAPANAVTARKAERAALTGVKRSKIAQTEGVNHILYESKRKGKAFVVHNPYIVATLKLHFMRTNGDVNE